MSDKGVDKKKTDWKRAFSLLKREAIRCFRIRHFERCSVELETPSSTANVTYNKNDEYLVNNMVNFKTDHTADSTTEMSNKYIPSTNATTTTTTTGYNNLNQNSSEKQIRLLNALNSRRAQYEKLGKTIIEGIIVDLKSRSNSSKSDRSDEQLAFDFKVNKMKLEKPSFNKSTGKYEKKPPLVKFSEQKSDEDSIIKLLKPQKTFEDAKITADSSESLKKLKNDDLLRQQEKRGSNQNVDEKKVRPTKMVYDDSEGLEKTKNTNLLKPSSGKLEFQEDPDQLNLSGSISKYESGLQDLDDKRKSRDPTVQNKFKTNNEMDEIKRPLLKTTKKNNKTDEIVKENVKDFKNKLDPSKNSVKKFKKLNKSPLKKDGNKEKLILKREHDEVEGKTDTDKKSKIKVADDLMREMLGQLKDYKNKESSDKKLITEDLPQKLKDSYASSNENVKIKQVNDVVSKNLEKSEDKIDNDNVVVEKLAKELKNIDNDENETKVLDVKKTKTDEGMTKDIKGSDKDDEIKTKFENLKKPILTTISENDHDDDEKNQENKQPARISDKNLLENEAEIKAANKQKDKKIKRDIPDSSEEENGPISKTISKIDHDDDDEKSYNQENKQPVSITEKSLLRQPEAKTANKQENNKIKREIPDKSEPEKKPFLKKKLPISYANSTKLKSKIKPSNKTEVVKRSKSAELRKVELKDVVTTRRAQSARTEKYERPKKRLEVIKEKKSFRRHSEVIPRIKIKIIKRRVQSATPYDSRTKIIKRKKLKKNVVKLRRPFKVKTKLTKIIDADVDNDGDSLNELNVEPEINDKYEDLRSIINDDDDQFVLSDSLSKANGSSANLTINDNDNETNNTTNNEELLNSISYPYNDIDTYLEDYMNRKWIPLISEDQDDSQSSSSLSNEPVAELPTKSAGSTRKSAKRSASSRLNTPASEPTEEVNEMIDEQEEFRKKKIETKPLIPDDFYYDYNAFIAQPVISEKSDLSQNLISLYHSFGYDCKKRANLQIIDPDCLLFSAGNVVEILNIRTKEQIHMRTTSGASVGCIAVDPTSQYFAVGEKGNMPNVNIFEFPSLKLFRILRLGALRGYAYLDFNTNGDLLASLGTAPDFMLTIWDWRQENIVLRTKSFSQDVFRVSFSKDLKGILTTAGAGHIKFWKMAKTFTGFKLQGELGKFGKTEISDIEGYTELPDGKVLSGCEWGNMLLWDGGLIQTEVCRKRNKPCHSGAINQITLDEGDIFTIGEDGSIRVWDFETIDTAEPSEDGVKLEIEPLNEIFVGKNVTLKSMVKDIVDESTFWYAQDGNGGIWKLDLSFSASSEDPRQLFSFHAGVINGISTCPNSHLIATTADDGTVKIYNYVTLELVAQKKYHRSGTSLKWLPLSVDEEGATIMVGFGDGVLRFFKLIYRPNSNILFELVLVEVFKPHTKAITCMEIDSKSGLIATGSEDNTVFFFSNVKNRRTPIGFITIPSPVTFMTWTPHEYKHNRLLVCMKDGRVHEYNAPVHDSYDVSKTYLIESKLAFRTYKFKSVKSKILHEQELERKRIEEEERKKREAELRKLRGEEEEEDKSKKKKVVIKEEPKFGELDDELEEGEEKKAEEEPVQEEVKKEEEWKPYIPEVPNKILWAHYASHDTFWVSMDDYDAGFLYECKFTTDMERSRITSDKMDEPILSVPVKKSDLIFNEDIPLTCLMLNKNKTHAFIGQKNGVIRYQPVPESHSLKDLEHYWSYGYHDNDYGRITHMCLSFDERFIFSVGGDSNIFACLFNCKPDVLETAKNEPINLPSKTSRGLTDEQDIEDINAYSIEQSKQKSEHDKMMATAESKKQEMRLKIGELRSKFKDLLIKNEQLPKHIQLDKSNFFLEESIKNQVLKQINDKIKQTYRELSWFTEKCRVGLEKVKSRFRDTIDFDHLRLFTFDMAYEVDTFRTIQLPKDIEQFENELTRQYTLNLLEKQKNKDSQETVHPALLPDTSNNARVNNPQSKLSNYGGIDELQDILATEGPSAMELANLGAQLTGPNITEQMKKLFSKLRGNTAVRVERALRKMEEKKLKRLKRRKEWEELLGARLPDDYENPDDLAAIKDAEDNLGDFKLKSSEDYILPEEQRMNVFKASKRLILIKQTMHKIQTSFNTRVLELRGRKIKLIEDLNKDIDRLEQIKFILSQKDFKVPERPRLKPEEAPEKLFECTKEKLTEFLDSRPERFLSEEDLAFAGFASAPSAGTKRTNELASQNLASMDSLSLNYLQALKNENIKPLWYNKELMSPIMVKRAKIEEIKLQHEQKKILRSIEEKISIFDAEIKLLRHEKAKIAILLKHVDLRHVTLYEEFMLLRDFEKTENELEEKLVDRKDDNLEMQGKLGEIQQKIDAKRKDIDKLDDKQKQLLDTFHQISQDETKFTDFLMKLYKKKIKRKKNVEGEEGEDDSDEESDDSDTEDEDLLEDDDDSEAEGREQLDLDMCPTGLSQELYDQICQLREKRLDLEELQAEEKKILEQFKKDQESAIKKAKVVENALKQAQLDLENFQKEKQKKINNLDIVVTMNFNQIQYVEKGYLPADLNEALVFDSKNLDRLQERIKELQAEKVNEKKSFKLLKERHLSLIRDKKKMEEYLARLQEACDKMAVDKFGKTVDIEKLELIMVNQQIEELKQRLAENEFEHEKVMKDWLKKINDEKDEGTELLKANTSRINELVDLLQETKKIEKTLNSKQKNLGEEFSGIARKDLEERERLQTLVQLQTQEIEALKAEISILSRKGGHILPPSQPPSNNRLQV